MLRAKCLVWSLALVCTSLACASTPAASIQSTVTAAAAPAAVPTDYIVGYGSLMQEASREHTVSSSSHAYPVIVEGFMRGWFAQADLGPLGITFLGAVARDNAKIWAIIYDVSPSDLAATDARERIYDRVEVRRDQLRFFKGMEIARDAKIWIYVAADEAQLRPPDAGHPIVQSYVDVFLGGCFELQDRYQIEDFAVHCLSSTQDWSRHWVNDRVYPRRPFVHEPNAIRIDRMLVGDSRTSDFFMGAKLE